VRGGRERKSKREREVNTREEGRKGGRKRRGKYKGGREGATQR
jgi:hypothetical protein